jgi:hypothetical protein
MCARPIARSRPRGRRGERSQFDPVQIGDTSRRLREGGGAEDRVGDPRSPPLVVDRDREPAIEAIAGLPDRAPAEAREPVREVHVTRHSGRAGSEGRGNPARAHSARDREQPARRPGRPRASPACVRATPARARPRPSRQVACRDARSSMPERHSSSELRTRAVLEIRSAPPVRPGIRGPPAVAIGHDCVNVRAVRRSQAC